MRDVDESTKSSGNILKLHQRSKRNCIIKYYTEIEVKAILDKKSKQI